MAEAQQQPIYSDPAFLTFQILVTQHISELIQALRTLRLEAQTEKSER